jgi:hypothetical protein
MNEEHAMATKIEKRTNHVKPSTPALVVPLKVASPPAMQHYYGDFFTSGADRPPEPEPADEYDRTLLAEAGRISCHARMAVYRGDVQAAGMLRDAARLLDLFQQRQNARGAAEDARKPSRKAARR